MEISRLGWVNDWVMCDGLTKAVVSRLHTFSHQWALPSYTEMTLDMVSAGAMFPGNPHLTSHYQNSGGGMFIMANLDAASDPGGGGARCCSTTNHSRLLYDWKKSSGAGCKTFTSGTWEMMLCSGNTQHTSTTRVNKAQNAQIQVNSHVVFTVQCHCLHDLGEKSSQSRTWREARTTKSFTDPPC